MTSRPVRWIRATRSWMRLTFIQNAKGTANVIADADGGKLDAAFKDGKVGFIFNGPWATGDYVKALGADKLGHRRPHHPARAASSPPSWAPRTSSSAPTARTEAAQAFLWFMAQPDTQAMLTKVGHIPSNPNVQMDDPFIAGFLKQTAIGELLPERARDGRGLDPGR